MRPVSGRWCILKRPQLRRQLLPAVAIQQTWDGLGLEVPIEEPLVAALRRYAYADPTLRCIPSHRTGSSKQRQPLGFASKVLGRCMGELPMQIPSFLRPLRKTLHHHAQFLRGCLVDCLDQIQQQHQPLGQDPLFQIRHGPFFGMSCQLLRVSIPSNRRASAYTNRRFADLPATTVVWHQQRFRSFSIESDLRQVCLHTWIAAQERQIQRFQQICLQIPLRPQTQAPN